MKLGQPKGDSFGSLAETVQPRRLIVGRYRTLRERQLALLVVCAGALAIVIDTSVVNVALPFLGKDLRFSASDLSWVVNAYVIPFGGLQLFAGRLGDLIGPKRLFIGGIALFTAASLACGLAQTREMLIAARFAQGVGGALAAAVVLSIVVAMFPKPGEQAKAIGMYSLISSVGAALGLVVGAAMTEAIDWHWVFFINLPIGVLAIVLGLRLLDDEREAGERGIDAIGAVLITACLMLAVYTIVQSSGPDGSAARTWALAGVSVLLLAAFVVRQATARNPLVPLGIFRARNVSAANLVQALMVAGMSGMFFLGALYLQQVLRLSVLEVGFAFVPTATLVAVCSIKVAPKLMKKVDARTVLLPGLLCITAGLLLLSLAPADGDYFTDVLPAMLLLGVGAGIGYPSALTIVLVDATTSDRGLRSGLVNTTQQIGPAIGLAILATVAANRTGSQAGHGHTAAEALTSGYHLAFLVGAGFAAAGIALTLLLVKPAVPRSAPNVLDATRTRQANELEYVGVTDPDFLTLGMGGTGMMAMLWSVAMGRRAVGVELRGSPYVSVMRWTVSEDVYHHLALIDQMMLERYGEEGVPRRGDGVLLKLADCFYTPYTDPGSVRGDEIVTGFAADSHIGGVARHHEHIDDRWRDGRPHREVSMPEQINPPAAVDPALQGRPMREVLDSPSSFQVGAEELLVVLRRYLEGIEAMDLARGVPPRVRILAYHRAVAPADRAERSGWRRVLPRRRVRDEEPFVAGPDGRVRIRVEAVRELDYKGSFRRVRVPNSEIVDLGTPRLFMIAQGADSRDARRLGFQQQPVCIDHGDGRGPVPAESDYLAGNVDIYLGDRIRHRVASDFDADGNEYWVRQVAIGHEGDAQIGWVLAEVPEYVTFDPILAGLVPPGTPKGSKRFFAGHQFLLRKYFLDQISLITEIPRDEMERNQLSYGPKLFTITERVGQDALVAPNGVVAGDSFGNGHFLHSGGVITGLVGHAWRVLRYWQAVDAGTDERTAIRRLADEIKADTDDWVAHSAPLFARPAPTATVAQPQEMERQRALAEATRYRRSIVPQNYPDEWSRIQLRTGRIYAFNLPPIDPVPPALRETGADAMTADAMTAPGREADRMADATTM
ncbi:MFS transporter [Actinoallomurus soli]|uniref:MFS transporter n=1 Tax=Actinoallomurus soli TaxID=2952535 RepID=UPI00209334F6|nr:MFS transporter [Actinoallomurus soli]MCO5969052.1 MFS transporter [Actinoallomurus soli]